MAKIPIILEPGRADGKLIKTNSVYDDNQEKFLSDKIKDIDNNHNNLKDEVNTLTEVVNNNESDIEAKLETEKTRATNTENNLRETINNITNINEHAATAELITVNTLPNSTVSNVQQSFDELFKNSTYIGVATPDINPGVPNSSVFYIATQAGTYSNFNNIEVTKGESVILKWNNGTWTKSSFKPMTDFNSVFDTEGNSLTEFESGIIYDVSAHNNGKVFESLQALLNSVDLDTLIPTSVRHGGISIRFVQSSDNKYVQYRLMTYTFSTTESDWQGVDDEPIAESNNIVKSGGVYTHLKELNLSFNGGTRTEIEHHENNEFILTANNTAARLIGNEGNISSDANYRSVKLLIPQNATKIKAFCCTKNQYYYGISFYSSSSISTSTFISGDTRPSSGTENQIVEINIPSNTAYVLVTVNANYVSDAFIDFIKETFIEGVNEKVQNIETNVQKLNSSVEFINENLNSKTITTEINHNSEEFNLQTVISRNANGNYNNVQDYKTIFLPIPENTIQIKAVCFANNQYYNGLTWYKGLTLTTANWLADYPMVSSISGMGNGLITIDEIPENAVAIAVTAYNTSNCYVTFTTQTYKEGLNKQVDNIKEITYPLQGYFKNNNAVSSYIASMNQGDELLLITPHAFKNYSVCFSMNFNSFFDGRVSLETINTYTSGHVEIDGTNIYIYRGSDTLEKTIPHGLTISHFLSVSIIQTSIHLETAKIIVCSQSGMFINSDTNNYWYAGGSNPYKLKMISGGCVNAKLTLSIHNCDVWLFGDSYMDYLVRNITSSVSNELTNLYIDGYPGRTSSRGLSSLNRAILIANPKILVWALGMNDGDSVSDVNPNWLSSYNSVKDICKSNGIELVLVTIPTTPLVNNNQKNNIIRNSGYRYIDVAMAVGSDETGEWNEGLLSSDNIHPTSAGSKVIFGKYIADLPNILK